MKTVSILHYHLHPGGVTSIIKSQVKALSQNVHYKIRLLTGDDQNIGKFENMGAEVVVDKWLNYLEEDLDPQDYKDVYRSVQKFLKENIRKQDSVIHFHNPNLGKNPVLTYVLYEMIESGYRAVYHIHDFAEDRPDRMDFINRVNREVFAVESRRVMYPRSGSCHYVTLTARDRDRVAEQGIRQESMHHLPNPVAISRDLENFNKNESRNKINSELDLYPEKTLVIYPVRVIRRKNIGEYLLLTALFDQEAEWLVTQPPKNPVEIEPYERWKAFARDHSLPVHFEAGEKADFEELMIAADLCMTTSTREGFGMVFLEPWTFGTPVKGRDISGVTADLKNNGINFPLLYENIIVPGKDGTASFDELDEEDQRRVIRACRSGSPLQDKIRKINPFLKNLLQPVDPELIRRNYQTIKKNYSLNQYQKKLNGIYQRLLEKN